MGNNGLLQDIISFEKGMLPQVDPINLPDGAYLDALNMMRNEVGVIATECGTSSVLSSIPGTIVGLINADDLIVVCSVSGATSYIGVLDVSDTYTTVCSNSILKFDPAIKLSLEYKEDYKKDKILYIGGKGIKLRRINLNTVGSIPLSEFDRTTALFLEYQLPVTKVLSIQSGGEVPTGIYQFACRLVTDAGDVTGFGIVSELFPVISSSATGFSDTKTMDGSPPQTDSPNMLIVEVSNIDTAFKYIEPCVITYIGQSNVLSIKSLGKKLITGSTLQFNYIGTSNDLGDILQEELTVSDVIYTEGNYITQKDSTLIIAGVKELEDTFDWQEVANSIVVSWRIKTLTHEEIITNVGQPDSYTLGVDTEKSTSFESYRNPENVSKYKGYRRGEVYSFAFCPIINGRAGKAYHIPAMTLQEASAILPGVTQLTGNVKTGSLKYPNTFPNLGNGTVLKNTSIRYHKMPEADESPFVVPYGGGQKEIHNVLGLLFNITATSDWKNNCDGYIITRENRNGKETKGAQGIAQRFYRYSNGQYGIIPGINSMFISGTDTVDHTSPTQLDAKNFIFCSPEIITDANTIQYSPTYIRKIHTENMRTIAAAWGTNQADDKECKAVVTRTSGSITVGLGVAQKLSPSVTLVPVKGNNNPMISGTNVSIPSHAPIDILVMRTLGGVLLSTDEVFQHNIVIGDIWVDNLGSGSKGYSYNPFPALEYKVDILELLIPSVDYYGDIYNKETFTIGYKLKKDFNVTQESLLCFGGDTYISKYALILKDGPAHFGTVQGSEKQAVPFISTMVYITVESKYNYYYRHYIVASGSTVGNAPYYPKQKNLDAAVAYDLSLGRSELYNKQYSAQNSLQSFYTDTIDNYTTEVFPNRIIYSTTSVEGEKFDAYRLFRVNNFHDIPKQFGNITGIFTQGTDLYIHTEKALWRAFYNTLVTQATSAGDVVLGNGGAFSRPSIPVVSLQGGYAGCKDISASVGTPLGRFFYDFTKSKLYLLGEGLQEISNPAVFDLLRTTIGAGDVSLGYDYGRKRVLLSSSAETISFKPELQSFDSRHNYTFSHFISRDLKDYMVKGSNLHYFDKTKVGSFFGTVYNSFIKVASVISPAISKRYVSGEVVLAAQDPTTKVNDPWAFFKTLKVYSRERNTGQTTFKVNPSFGEIEQFGQVLVSKANNKFRFGFAPDIVDDINLDIQDPYNLKSHSRFTDEDRMFLPDMVDNHVILEFTIDNNQQKEIKIQSLIINFDQNIT